ncbi:hypothetical protein BK668_06650 [Pseudomonas fluorescens]|nr:hypothetical protein BK668_06650 [Pseudomonas fluorescens]
MFGRKPAGRDVACQELISVVSQHDGFLWVTSFVSNYPQALEADIGMVANLHFPELLRTNTCF